MGLGPGTRLGPYEVVALLGAGGIEEIYTARDTKLDRDVALKVLPESFVHDPDHNATTFWTAHTMKASSCRR